MSAFRARIEKYKRAYLLRIFVLLISFGLWSYGKDVSSLTDLLAGAIIILILELLFVDMATERDFFPASAITYYLAPERESALNFYIFLGFYLGYMIIGLVALFFWV